MVDNIIPVIISGGSGSRLWPMSTQLKPKQFIDFFEKKSTFDLALERCKSITKESPIIILSKEHTQYVDESCKKYGIKNHKIIEATGRNTCSAILLGALKAFEINPFSNILIMPSDHLFTFDELAKIFFTNSYLYTKKFNWITFGLKPTIPSESYGYIKTKKSQKLKTVLKFIEKPNRDKAKEYILDTNYFWNSGIFFGSSNKIINSIKRNAIDIYDSTIITWNKKKKIHGDYFLDLKLQKSIRSESIDYAVLENEESIGMVELENSWKDIGTWDSMAELSKARDFNLSSKEIQINSNNNFIYSKDHLVATIDINDIIVVAKGKNILIVKKGSSQKVKDIIDRL